MEDERWRVKGGRVKWEGERWEEGETRECQGWDRRTNGRSEWKDNRTSSKWGQQHGYDNCHLH